MRITVLLLLALALDACSATPRPDLRRLYEFGTATASQPPVIVIPGILGSKLRDGQTGNEIWPGSLRGLLLGTKEQLALPFDPQSLQLTAEARPDGLFEAVLGTDFCGEILRTLEKAGGYRRAVPGRPADPRERRYYVFAYDWRQDNVRTAAKLDAFIDQVRRDYGDPTGSSTCAARRWTATCSTSRLAPIRVVGIPSRCGGAHRRAHRGPRAGRRGEGRAPASRTSGKMVKIRYNGHYQGGSRDGRGEGGIDQGQGPFWAAREPCREKGSGHHGPRAPQVRRPRPEAL